MEQYKPNKAIYLPCVALSFRLGTFIRLLVFRAFVGQILKFLFWFGLSACTGYYYILNFYILTIHTGTTKSVVLSGLPFVAGWVCFLYRAKRVKSRQNCRISLVLPFVLFCSRWACCLAGCRLVSCYRIPFVWVGFLLAFFCSVVCIAFVVWCWGWIINSKTKNSGLFGVAVCLFVLSVYYSLEKLFIYSRLWL